MAISYNLSQSTFENVRSDSGDVPKVNLKRSMSEFPNWENGMLAFCHAYVLLLHLQYCTIPTLLTLFYVNMVEHLSHTPKHHHLQLYQYLSQPSTTQNAQQLSIGWFKSPRPGPSLCTIKHSHRRNPSFGYS